MSKKKKANPNRVPLAGSIDHQKMMEEEARQATFEAWVLFMGAMSDFYETDQKQLLDLWKEVNEFSKSCPDFFAMSPALDNAEKLLGRSLPHPCLSIDNIKTKGAFNKLRREMHENGLHAGFILITCPLLKNGKFDVKTIQYLVTAAYELNEEIKEHRITLDDLIGVLRDEYSLELLKSEDQTTVLHVLDV